MEDETNCADLVGDGVIGDNEREGNEEAMMSYNQIVTIDMISHGVRQKGKLSDQKTVINFRENGRDRLAYWLANRMDQLAFLTLGGIDYSYNNNLSARTSSAFSNLAFATDVKAPSTNRGFRVTSSGATYTGLAAADTAAVTATDHLTYQAIVDIVTKAKTNYVKPLMAAGKEYYIGFIRPEQLAQLKKDDNFQRAVVTGLPRGEDNPFFSGGTVTVDGLNYRAAA
jgi:N4-gp56 family major capsid protein